MRLLLLEKPMQGLVRQLRTRELLPLGAAIFLLFSVLGPTTDLLAGARQPLFVLIGNTLFSGLLALGYAFGSMRRSYPVLAISVAAQVLWIAGARRLPGTVAVIPPQLVADRLTLDALATLIAMVGSYVCFLWFINAGGAVSAR